MGAKEFDQEIFKIKKGENLKDYGVYKTEDAGYTQYHMGTQGNFKSFVVNGKMTTTATGNENTGKIESVQVVDVCDNYIYIGKGFSLLEPEILKQKIIDATVEKHTLDKINNSYISRLNVIYSEPGKKTDLETVASSLGINLDQKSKQLVRQAMVESFRNTSLSFTVKDTDGISWMIYVEFGGGNTHKTYAYPMTETMSKFVDSFSSIDTSDYGSDLDELIRRISYITNRSSKGYVEVGPIEFLEMRQGPTTLVNIETNHSYGNGKSTSMSSLISEVGKLNDWGKPIYAPASGRIIRLYKTNLKDNNGNETYFVAHEGKMERIGMTDYNKILGEIITESMKP